MMELPESLCHHDRRMILSVILLCH